VDVAGISRADAATIGAEPAAATIFETVVAAGIPGREAANWVTGEYLRLARKYGEGDVPHVEPEALGRELAELARLLESGGITRTNAKEVFEAAFTSGRAVGALVDERGLRAISDSDALGRLADDVIASNPAAVADYRAGKGQAIGFLVGQVMKATRGQANAAAVTALIRERLDR
jgi:aspartyl-tRNA(Asn)/glutamyl-tRNA(Gln) amidotransferase subunit B